MLVALRLVDVGAVRSLVRCDFTVRILLFTKFALWVAPYGSKNVQSVDLWVSFRAGFRMGVRKTLRR